jgi:glycosyltransferase involved in cell wall biosynthesis
VQAVSSALGQTYKHLEVLILDDASPDDTPKVGSALAARDPRVIYVRRQHNLGITGNWRDGISRARGEFFCILHDDDTFEPQFVESLIRPMCEHPNVAMAFCDQWVMSADGRRSPSASNAASIRFGRDRLRKGLVPDMLRAALVNFSLPIGATLFRRSTFGPHLVRDEAKGALDYWVFYQIVRSGADAYFVPMRLMNYRTHSGSMSGAQPIYMSEGHLFRLKSALHDPVMTEIWPELRKERARVLTGYGIALLRLGETTSARSALWQALRQRRSVRALAALALAWAGKAGPMLARRLKRDMSVS